MKILIGIQITYLPAEILRILAAPDTAAQFSTCHPLLLFKSTHI
jgi:hypothetical protein